MNTREENVAEAMREAARISQQEQRHRAQLDWAGRWEAGDAHCPRCAGTQFSLADVEHDGPIRYERFSCQAHPCEARWTVELRETALRVLHEDDAEDDWIELPTSSASQETELTARERATLLAALRYWQREGLISDGHERDIATDAGRHEALSGREIDQLYTRLSARHGESPPASDLPRVDEASRAEQPSLFRILIEDGIVVGVHVLTDDAMPDRAPLFIVREYESDDSLDAAHRTGVDEEGRSYYEHAVEVRQQAVGADSRAHRRGGEVDLDLSALEWEDISPDPDRPRSRLLATVRFGAVPHHLEAIAVRSGACRFDQQETCAQCEQILEHYSAVDADAGPFSTVECDGRRYALFVTPFRY